jgi:hypothetical protein
MSFKTVITKIGGRIVSVLEFPLKRVEMLTAFAADVKVDFPETAAVLRALVEKFEALSPEVLAAVAAKGFDVPEDIKAGVDLKAIFAYVQSVVYPTIEKDFADFERDKAISAAPVATLPEAAEVVTAAVSVAHTLAASIPA